MTLNETEWVSNRTRLKRVVGVYSNQDGDMYKVPIDVMLTVDKYGESLSFGLGSSMMLQISLETVEDLIQTVK